MVWFIWQPKGVLALLRPVERAVVRLARDYFDVSWVIVRLVSIEVMNLLSRIESTANLSLRNNSMFVRIAANIRKVMIDADAHNYVAVRRDGFPAAPVRVRFPESITHQAVPYSAP